MPKLNLKSFSKSSQQTKQCTISNKETILRADRRLFERMLMIASSRKIDMEVVLQHSLGPLPCALSHFVDSLKKTNKAAMARHLEQQLSSQERMLLFHLQQYSMVWH